MKRKIDVAIVIGDPDFCALGISFSPEGVVGDPLSNVQRIILPNLITQIAVDLRRHGRPLDSKFRAVLGVDSTTPKQKQKKTGNKSPHRVGIKTVIRKVR